MGKIKDWFKKTFGQGEQRPSSSSQTGKINIIRRTDEGAQPTRPSNGGRITIGRINNTPPPASGGFRPEVPVDNPNLSGGIRVERRRKPGTCPMCRSTGTVIDNPGGRPKWKCSACEHTFN